MSWRDRIVKEQPSKKSTWRDRIVKEQPSAVADAGEMNIVDKIKAIPGGIAAATEMATDYLGKSMRGEVSLAEQAERLGTAARGAGDVIQAVGDLPSQAIAKLLRIDYDGARAKETARVLDKSGLASKESLDAKDAKYPGARVAGQALPAIALPGSSAGGVALQGALGSYGSQVSDKGSAKLSDVVDDTALGLGTFRAGQGVGKAATKAAELTAPIGKKAGLVAGRVVTGLPEDVIERYISRNAQVRGAKSLETIAEDTTGAVKDLGKRVSRGSGESGEILAREGVIVPTGPIKSNLDARIAQFEEGGLFTREAEIEVAKLKDLRTRLEKFPTLEGKQAKEFLKQIDGIAYPQQGAADITPRLTREFREVRKGVDEQAKELSPAFKEKMSQVASDSKLLDRLSPGFSSDEASYSSLNRIAREKAPFRDRTLKDLGEATGNDFSEAARDAMAKDAFTKPSVNGSRNVQVLRDVPWIGPLLGYAADYVARPGAAKAIDIGVAMKDALAKSSVPAKFAKVLQDAANQGPAKLVMTHQMLMKLNTEYKKLVESEQ